MQSTSVDNRILASLLEVEESSVWHDLLKTDTCYEGKGLHLCSFLYSLVAVQTHPEKYKFQVLPGHLGWFHYTPCKTKKIKIAKLYIFF